jgi:glycosyltransferase involved in cell wall biosynthesis
MPCYAAQLDTISELASEFDVLHCHTDWIHFPLVAHLGVPHVTTFHNRLDTPELPGVMRRFADAPVVSISDHHRLPMPWANWLGTIYHGMPTDTLTPSYEPGNYLVFLGRLTKEKGPEVAIRLAKAAGMPLKMAAKIPRSETRYYKERVAPLLDGEQIQLVGELRDDAKANLLRGAAALLFPIDWPEPFGLVMIEAMACGTPVIAYRRGSVPEVIDDGLTGFIVDDEDQAVAAIERVGELDRRQVRATFERRFSARRMAEDYVRAYESLLAQDNHRASQPGSSFTSVSADGQASNETVSNSAT